MKKSLKRKLKKFNYTQALLVLGILLVIPMLRLTPFPDGDLQLRQAAPNNSHLAVEMPIERGSFRVTDVVTGHLAGQGTGSSDLLGLSPGIYNVEFEEVTGYLTPEPQKVHLYQDKLTSIEGFYEPIYRYPLLGVRIFPETVRYNIIDMTTNTKVAGGTGSDFFNLPPGKYKLEFYSLEDFNKLPDQYFLMAPKTVTTINGAFGKTE